MAELTATKKSTMAIISKEVAKSTPYLTGEFNLSNPPAAVLAQQKDAREALAKLPFPGNKDEPWRKTSLRDFPLDELYLAKETQIELSKAPEGVTFITLKEALATIPDIVSDKMNTLVNAKMDKFSALASGYAQDGFVLIVPKGMQVEETLEATFTIPQNGTIQNSHVLMWIEERASATLHLSYKGAKGSQTAMNNSIVEIKVAENAHFHVVEQQELGYETWQFSHEKASINADATLDWVYLAFGSKLTKSFVEISLDGKGCEARLNGISISNSGQHIDLDTQQDHMAPVTFSDLTFKTALLGTSNTVWQGMIYVDPKAYQTDGYQSSRNMLLDTRAHADAIPGLEIKTDDVRCSHGATISQIDEEQIFYLKARGLDEATACELIVNGFFQDIVDKVRDEDLRLELQHTIHDKLNAE